MGIYLNPGKNAFEEAMNSEIFVDKTEVLEYLNSVVRTKQKSIYKMKRIPKKEIIPDVGTNVLTASM